MESPRKMTSPAPLLCSIRRRKSWCRGMSRLSFRAAGLSESVFWSAADAGRARLTTRTQPAVIERNMGYLEGERADPERTSKFYRRFLEIFRKRLWSDFLR